MYLLLDLWVLFTYGLLTQVKSINYAKLKMKPYSIIVKGIETKLSIEIIDFSMIDIKRLYIDEASIESGFRSI